MIVIDSSALVKALVEKGESGAAVRKRLLGEAIHAPTLIDAEVLSVLRGLALGRKLSDERAATALNLLATMPITRVPATQHLRRAWQLRGNYSACDALYIALAEALDCPLVTSDARLSRAAGARCAVAVYA